jgi:asparagine synthase (glutamine-hydrolysing)
VSAQFGRWNFDGKPVEQDYLEKVRPLLAPYGPDDAGSFSEGNISILYRALHTTKESRCETQPHATASGAILTWDGRIDNRADLISDLRNVLTIGSTDVEIVAAAHNAWGSGCFGKLLGDWALSIWDPNTRSLILAKDPIGTRHLYYSIDKDQVTWSSILDPLVVFAGRRFALCEEYVAGWFSFFPAAHLTPYVGVHSVPPSSYVLLRPGKHTVTNYWNFDPGKRIRYRTDAEYEEHFLAVFAEAVRRRLRADSPILAELSGGMDSSSIVCMADTIIARGTVAAPRVDTLSYYDDSEPNWDERPYFSKVEEKRGRIGCHIDLGKEESLISQLESECFAATPSSGGGRHSESRLQFAACMRAQGHSVVLSGIGGDEVTGGVPTPIPELEDLIARAQFRRLAHQLKVWALNKRKPWVHVFFESFRGFLPPVLVGVSKHKRPAPWLNSRFVKRNRVALQGYETRVKLLGPSPSFQENISTLGAVQRQLACEALPVDPTYEKRYPYLDRELLEFMYAIPREQLVRPGQRRSLTRRALAGIVPNETLTRKRKAFVARAPIAVLLAEWTNLLETTRHMVSGSLGIVDPERFSEALQKAPYSQDPHIVPLMRTLGIEFWLKSVRDHEILDGNMSSIPQGALRMDAHKVASESASQQEFS